ncbi:hypothetical protein Tco_1573986, partial [Tanacetum coccineum]
ELEEISDKESEDEPEEDESEVKSGASGNSNDDVKDSCLLGLCSAGSDSLSASESLEHKKGETNCRILVILRSSKNNSEMWVGMLERKMMEMDECINKMYEWKMEQPTLSKTRRGCINSYNGRPWAGVGPPMGLGPD